MAVHSSVPFLYFRVTPGRIAKMRGEISLMALVQPVSTAMRRNSRACGTGQNKQLRFLQSNVLMSAACYAVCIKTIGAPQDSEAERYGNALHHFGQVNLASFCRKCAQNAVKQSENAWALHKRSRKTDVFGSMRTVKFQAKQAPVIPKTLGGGKHPYSMNRCAMVHGN